jgi:hypothetical protein
VNVPDDARTVQSGDLDGILAAVREAAEREEQQRAVR